MTREEARADLMLAQADISYRPKDDSIEMAIEALKNQKTGHWVDKGGAWDECLECSICGCELIGIQTDILKAYCPNCGAKMERGVK